MLSDAVDLLVLGGGWTYTFLKPLIEQHDPPISHLATTRDGRDGTLKWTWDQNGSKEQYEALPKAQTVVIVFPIRGKGLSKAIVEGYEAIHGKVKWIQLGSTGIWDKGPTLKPDEKKPALKWTTRHSHFDTSNDRAIAEIELLKLSNQAYVLNLCGLWGGARDPKNWISRVITSKEVLAGKTSIHFVHGVDVARAIIAVHLAPPPHDLKSQRYILTDLRVYDWWDLASSTEALPQINGWVRELMQEHGVHALPRPPEQLGRAMDGREFWNDFGLAPARARYEGNKL